MRGDEVEGNFGRQRTEGAGYQWVRAQTLPSIPSLSSVPHEPLSSRSISLNHHGPSSRHRQPREPRVCGGLEEFPSLSQSPTRVSTKAERPIAVGGVQVQRRETDDSPEHSVIQRLVRGVVLSGHGSGICLVMAPQAARRVLWSSWNHSGASRVQLT